MKLISNTNTSEVPCHFTKAPKMHNYGNSLPCQLMRAQEKRCRWLIGMRARKSASVSCHEAVELKLGGSFVSSRDLKRWVITVIGFHVSSWELKKKRCHRLTGMRDRQAPSMPFRERWVPLSIHERAQNLASFCLWNEVLSVYRKKKKIFLLVIHFMTPKKGSAVV